MDKSVLLVIVAIIISALIPIVPKLMRFRIKVFRFLRWNWLANLHERYFDGFVLAVRLIIAGVAIVVLVVGLS